MNTVTPLQALGAELQSSSSPTRTGLLLYRKCACGASTALLTDRCTECSSKGRPQTKLAIGASNDPLEQEADRVADQVIEGSAHSHVSNVPPRIQRRSEQAAGETGTAPPSIDSALASSGSPMESALRDDMEQRFGHNFSRVRVHSGAVAEQSARDVSADAYTVGASIVFGRGRYAPATREGQHLIAHELTHVVQSGEGGPSGSSQAPDRIRRQRTLRRAPETAAPRMSFEEYKKLDPTLKALTWGADFARGFKRSGAEAQLGDVAMGVFDNALTSGSPEERRMFEGGTMVGIPAGILVAGGSAAKSLALLGWEFTKLLVRLRIAPSAVISELFVTAKSAGLAIMQMFDAAELLGLYTGHLISKEAHKFAITFINSSAFDQGFVVGQLIGRLIGEVALLFIGVEEVSLAARALAETRIGAAVLRGMSESPLLGPLLKAPEISAGAKAAAKASGEAAEGTAPLKAAAGDLKPSELGPAKVPEGPLPAGAGGARRPPLPGPAEHFPFGSGREPLPIPETPNKLYRIMGMGEAALALKSGKLPAGVAGTMGSKFLSLDSKYAILFREKTLEEISKMGEGIAKAEANLVKVESRLAEVEAKGDQAGAAKLRANAEKLRAEIAERSAANKAATDPMLKDWFDAPGQKVVVEVEVETGTIEQALNRAVDERLIKQYHGKDVYIWKFERGYGRNIAIPPWQLDSFNGNIKGIRFYAERGLELVGPKKIPPGFN